MRHAHVPRFRLSSLPIAALALVLAAGPLAAHELVAVRGDVAVSGGEQLCFTLQPESATSVRVLVRTRFSSRVPRGRVELDGAAGPSFLDAAEEFSFVVRPVGVHRLVLRLDEGATLDRLIIENRDGPVIESDCARYEEDQRRRVEGPARTEEPPVDRLGRPPAGSQPPAGTAPTDDQAGTATGGVVPAGTELEVKMNGTVSTQTAYVGQRFTTELVRPQADRDGRVVLPEGTRVEGRVVATKDAGRYGRSELRLAFDRAVLPDGRSVDVQGSLQRLGEGSAKKQGAIIAGSAAGGALLGQILGGDTESSVLGAIIGGGIAAGTIGAKKGESVVVPAGTVLGVRLEEAVEIPGPREDTSRAPRTESTPRQEDDWGWVNEGR